MLDFVSKRHWYFLLSALVILPGIIALAVFGLKLGVDFRQGTSMTLTLSTNVEESRMRDKMVSLGYKDAIVQTIGENKFFIRVPGSLSLESDGQKIVNGINDAFPNSNASISDFFTISPAVASQTARNAIIAVAVASVCILLYLTFAFRRMPNPFRWGTCAVIALVHDILVVLGIFSILGRVAGYQVDVMFITATLTMAGYSVHDTIVVFDRIRENMTKGIGSDFEETVNYSIVQTLTRSLNTSLTVILTIVTLLLLVGGTIHNFLLVLLIGIITGTYSSVCNASQLLIVWETGKWRGHAKKKIPVAAIPVAASAETERQA
jgi:preprotein translocase subunit SecF